MAERTPEFYQIDKIVDEAVSDGLLSVDDEGVDTDTRFIRNLAAPLEAANARIRELEAELARLRIENAAFRSDEKEVLAVAQEAGYATPPGDSDSGIQAVLWMAEQLEQARTENARLRQIADAARAAGQITKDGKFARLGMKVWHPKYGPIFAYVGADEDDNINAGFCVGYWDGFGEPPEDWTYYAVSDCYSTPESAQAAKEGKQ